MTEPSGKAYQPRKNIGWWTDQRIEQLKLLWSAGQSATEIMAAMGAGSRSGVLGKVHRLQLPGRVTQHRAAVKPTKPIRSRHSVRTLVPGGCSPEASVRAEKARHISLRLIAEHAAADALIAAAGGVSLFDIGPGKCRWPMTEIAPITQFRFCGRTATDGSYCGEHRARSINRSGFRAEAAE